MRRFGTQGPVDSQEHYVVSRSDERIAVQWRSAHAKDRHAPVLSTNS